MPAKQLWMFEDYEEVRIVSSHTKKSDNYEDFVEKFEPKKSTDDCYTPPEIMDAVNAYVRALLPPERRDAPFVRPFNPSGDYQHFDYPEGCVVVDNPPFSIYTQIVKWYTAHRIDFFLFAPAMTCIVKGVEAGYHIVKQSVKYENGADVPTAFITSLHGNVVVNDALLKALKQDKKRSVVRSYDPHLTSAALLRKYDNLTIPAGQWQVVDNFDGLKARNKTLFGAGIIVSDAVAATLRRDADATSVISPSDREQAIIDQLNANSHDD